MESAARNTDRMVFRRSVNTLIRDSSSIGLFLERRCEDCEIDAWNGGGCVKEQAQFNCSKNRK